MARSGTSSIWGSCERIGELTIILLDDAGEPDPVEPVLYWNGYAAPNGGRSVSAYLEENAERLRARYLAFIHDLGESPVRGKRLREHFNTADGFSLWWMNRVAEKSPFKCPRIFDCLRLLALEEMLRRDAVPELTLHSSDDRLAASVRELCRGLGIRFRRPPGRKLGSDDGLRGLYARLPHPVQGLLSFRHLLLRWPFRKLRPIPWFSGERAIFACSYLYNLDQVESREGRFHSRQWEKLPRWLHEHGWRVNWLHHYLPDGMDVESARSLLGRFNSEATSQGAHSVLESYLSAPLVLRALSLWVRTLAKGQQLGDDVKELFRPADSAAWFWPLLEDDWRNSMGGTASASNCVWHVLFDAALADIPHQPRGVYLYEGQGWESAMVHAWRKHGHGEILAMPHSSMPFWYLNIYDDPRCHARDAACGKPQPDRWVLNGAMAWDAFVRAGYSEDRLAPVEALRYLYLIPVTATVDRKERTPGAAVRVLVLGDYAPGQTMRMLAAMAEAVRGSERPVEVTVKLHPACRIDASEKWGAEFRFVDQPLGEILGEYDIAFSGNSTSGGLDALLAGLGVIVFLDEETFNHSPLKGVSGVAFAATADGIADAIRGMQGTRDVVGTDTFFWLDEDLPRWEALLASS